MQTDLDNLRDRLIALAKASPVAGRVKDVTLEPGCDDDGADFLRVLVEVKRADNDADEDFEALLESIEHTVGELDERYASVRFLDAA